jgi:tetratricopeptide (TPR) repeat protein
MEMRMALEQRGLMTADELLQRGLELYGQNHVAEAIGCWREALALAPDDRRARDFLESAGVDVDLPSSRRSGVALSRPAEPSGAAAEVAPQGPSPPSKSGVAAIDRAALTRLLEEKRFEEALDLLYAQREASPDDAAVSRGIRAIKEHLILRYGRALGSLDRVPMRERAGEGAALPAEQQHVLRLIDGLASFGDVIHASQLGRFETYRLLCSMLEARVLSARAPSVRMPVVRSPPPEPTAEAAAPPSDAPITRPSPSVSPAPPSSMTVSHAVLGSEGDAYERSFALATEAYLRRDFMKALHLYRACLTLRPDDARAAHNLRKLTLVLLGSG